MHCSCSLVCIRAQLKSAERPLSDLRAVHRVEFLKRTPGIDSSRSVLAAIGDWVTARAESDGGHLSIAP
jgi:hypothetical protein